MAQEPWPCGAGAQAVWHRSPGCVAQEPRPCGAGAQAVWCRSPGRVAQETWLCGTNRPLVLGRKQQEVWPSQLQCAGAKESQTFPTATFSVITLSDTMVTMLSSKAGSIQA